MDAKAPVQKKNTSEKDRKLSTGVAVLTASTLVVKILGLIYKIPLLGLLGAEGMGYFNAALEVYSLFFIISSSGLPAAECLLVSESLGKKRENEIGAIYRAGVKLFLILGLMGALGMILFSGFFASFIDNEKARLCLVCVAPAVAFSCFSGAARGLFQGRKDMRPTAVSQCVEALGKVIFGCLFSYAATKRGAPVSTAAAMGVLGLSVGSLFSFLYLCIVRRKTFPAKGGKALREPAGQNASGILKSLLWLAFPMTLGTLLSGLGRGLDTFIILRRLPMVGYDRELTAAMYGSFSTLVIPVYNLPGAFMSCIVSSMMPGLSEAYAQNRDDKAQSLREQSFAMCALVALPCALGFAFFSRPALSLLFRGQIEAVSVSAPLLALLSFSVFPSCLVFIVSGILQAGKRPYLPMIAMGAGCIVKGVSEWILLGIASFGIKGAIYSTFFGNVVTLGLELLFARKYGLIRGRGAYGCFWSYLGYAAASVGAGVGFYLLLDRFLSGSQTCFLLSLGVCAIIYVIILATRGEFSRLGMNIKKAGSPSADFAERG